MPFCPDSVIDVAGPATAMSDTARVCMTTEVMIPAAQSLLTWLLDSKIMLAEEWDELPAPDRDTLSRSASPDELLASLVNLHLLTPFQVDAVRRGDGGDLVLGQYRLLDLLGAGGMGTVYRGEHLHLRREVAVKVMTRAADSNPRLVNRFYAEARAVARLQHPNIATCFDAGRHSRASAHAAHRDYFVMELIPGQDLYALIREKGPLSPVRACELFRQVADALAEAHRHGLIHRDIKPSNILITPDWQAKVLDFGLARMPERNVTEPGTLLGTVGYMAPEQARDPHAIDSRADLFSLGATLYWTLTGREPYPETGNPLHDLHRRLTTCPVPVRQLRPEVPAEVSDLVSRLMDSDPDMRFPSARAAAAALTGFGLWLPSMSLPIADPTRRERVMIVEDDTLARGFMVALLKDRYDILEAGDAEKALASITRDPPDLVAVDVNLPGMMSGPELIERMRAAGMGSDRVSVLLMSGGMPEEALGGLSLSMADDYLPKPFKPVEFVSRVRALLHRRAAYSNPSGTHPGAAGIGPTVRIPASTTVRPASPSNPPTRAAATPETLSLTVSRLLAETNLAADGHWARIARYIRALAGAVADHGEYARLKDDAYLDLLAGVAPVYDIGLLAIPRGLLMKPEKLDSDEQAIMQSHTTVGSEILQGVAGKLISEVPCLAMAAEVARSHHERWDGGGYPDQLVGTETPLAARVVALVAVYEALRVRRPHRPAQTHSRAVRVLTSDSPGQFDPVLLAAFSAVSARFDQIHLAG